MTKYSNQLSLLVLVIGMFIVSMLWLSSRKSEIDERRLATEVTGQQVQLRLAACVQSRVDLVNALSDFGWQNSEVIKSGWREKVAILHSVLPGIQALNYVNPDWMIEIVYPHDPNVNALGKYLTDNRNASVLASLPIAENSEQIVRTDIIDLLQSGKGFVLYKKIVSPSGEHLGYVNGVFRVQDLMETCLGEEDLKQNFRFAVLESDGRLVYSQATHPGPWLGEVMMQIDVAGRPWQLVFAPSEALLASQNHWVTDLLVLLGALLVLVAYFSIRSLLRSQSILRESQEKYRVLVENQTDMVVEVDTDAAFTYVSPSYCEAFGKSEAELIGHTFLPVVHDDDREATEKSLASLSSPPFESYHEQRAMTKDGWRWLAWSNKGVVNAEGELEAIIAVGRDVTDVKALEESMAQTEKMRALGELAGGISHDFNNLLQIMLGNLEFLIDQGAKAGDSQGLVIKVRDAVQRAMQLTEKLSGLSRQQTSQRSVIDLNLLAYDIMALMTRTIPESISLHLEQAEQPLPVRVDSTQIEQVVLNLYFNARDAISNIGSINVELKLVQLDEHFCRLHPELAPGDYVRLSVTDTGKGITEQEVGKVFDPFFTTKEPGSGTGLGLSNCFSIIQQHSGTITVESMPERGSTFSVYLPALAAEAITETDIDLKETLPGMTSVSAKSKKVLVVDDSEEVRSLVCLQLKHLGFESLQAVNGVEALAIFKDNQDDICLIILDMVMPEMDGQTTAAEIMKITSDMPLFFMSGYSPEVTGSSELQGALLKKPFRSGDLEKLVEQSLGTRN